MKTLLVANRGEIARRVIRAAKDLGYRTAVPYSDADAHSPFVAEADIAVALGGQTAAESYLDQEKILRAAAEAGADAIHPGYGFLSENAGFARACAEAGIVFVGPPADAVETMGLKDRAKAVARRAGVPVLPDAVVSGDHPAAWRAAAEAVGYPLLVKATAGGGGKGMRRVDRAEDLADAVEGARREAGSSFGNADVFCEKYLTAPRHVEIQVFADTHGNVVHLNERECSVQRRHQKVIEEAPSPAVDADLRARMGATAVSLAKELGYTGAGTIEYLLDDRTGEFYFLEMNTRLQVEHPVTEEVTGLDLVRLQLQVAAGEPLGFTQEDVRLDGHAIEVRLYAEDPSRDFAPAPGPVHRYRHGGATAPTPTPTAAYVRDSCCPSDRNREHNAGGSSSSSSSGSGGSGGSGRGIRWEDGIGERAEISPFYDPMIAKVIAHGATRREAALRLSRALAATEVHGTATNLVFLTAALSHDDFLAGETRTDFIDLHPELLTAQPPTPEHVHLAAAVAVTVARRRAQDKLTRSAPPRFRLLPGHPDTTAVWDEHEISYHLSAASGDATLRLTVDGEAHELILRDLTTDSVRVRDGSRDWPCRVAVHPDGSVWVNDPDGQRGFTPQPRLPEHAGAGGSGPVADMAGTVVAVKVKPGDEVTAGQQLVIVEAMKMEWPTVAPEDGTVEAVHVREGEYVEAKKVLVTFA